MAAKSTNVITAEQILAVIGSSQPNTGSGAFTDWLADTASASIDRAGSIAGAVVAAGGNFAAHYKMERGVQQTRAQLRLQQAAERAAARINALTH